MKIFLPSIFLALLFLTSCEQDDCLEHDVCNTDLQRATSTITWGGPIEADGCGYNFIIDGVHYAPENPEIIPEYFQLFPISGEPFEVNISYRFTCDSLWRCGWALEKAPTIILESIEFADADIKVGETCCDQFVTWECAVIDPVILENNPCLDQFMMDSTVLFEGALLKDDPVPMSECMASSLFVYRFVLGEPSDIDFFQILASERNCFVPWYY